MAVQTIQYQNKVALNTNPDIADINKVTDNDMNEIKSVVNNNANEISTNSATIQNVINAEIYSTNEIKTNGVWIDGKPIYRRVISFGALPNNDTKNYDVSSWNIDRLIYLYGSTQNPTSGNARPLLFTGNQSAVVRIDKQANNIRLITYDTTWGGYTNTEVIAKYTKTTD